MFRERDYITNKNLTGRWKIVKDDWNDFNPVLYIELTFNYLFGLRSRTNWYREDMITVHEYEEHVNCCNEIHD